MVSGPSEDEIDDLLYFARIGDKEEFNTLKHELCERDKLATLAELLELARDEMSGNGALHMAAANGHDDLLKELCTALSKPSPQNPAMLATINAQNKSGNTPLHWAALNGHLPSVQVLLENGADPTITNQRGHDAVFEAEINQKNEVVEWILKEAGDGLEEAVGNHDIGGTEDQASEEDLSTSENVSTDMVEDIKQMDINDSAS